MLYFLNSLGSRQRLNKVLVCVFVCVLSLKTVFAVFSESTHTHTHTTRDNLQTSNLIADAF